MMSGFSVASSAQLDIEAASISAPRGRTGGAGRCVLGCTAERGRFFAKVNSNFCKALPESNANANRSHLYFIQFGGPMLQTLLIAFREGLEALLIVAIAA